MHDGSLQHQSLKAALHDSFQSSSSTLSEASGRKTSLLHSSVPVLDLAVPAAGGYLGTLQRVPLCVDADALVRFDGAVWLAGLPVPEPEPPLAVPAHHIAPIRREVGLTRVPCHRVALRIAKCQHISFISSICETNCHANLYMSSLTTWQNLRPSTWMDVSILHSL